MKNSKVIFFILILVLAVFLTSSMLHAADDITIEPCNVPFENILYEKHSGINEPGDYIVDNEKDFCALWDKIYSNRYPRPKCDTSLVDFEEEFVIASAMGQKPNSCYDNEIACISKQQPFHKNRTKSSEKGNFLHVLVNEYKPDREDSCYMVVISPIDIVVLSKEYYDKTVFYHSNHQLKYGW